VSEIVVFRAHDQVPWRFAVCREELSEWGRGWGGINLALSLLLPCYPWECGGGGLGM